MGEIWKNIPGYEDYMVSNLGNVKSLKKGKELLMKTSNWKGYLRVRLYNNSNHKDFKVHQLVAITFLNHKIDGHIKVIDHINNDKSDNRLENLQIITNRENSSKDKKNKSSKYTGVSFHKQANKWVSMIRDGNKRIHLGSFDNEIDAHKAYLTKLDEINKKIK